MSQQFEFSLPNGKKVRTGNIRPQVKALGSFQEFPKAQLLTPEDIRKIIANPTRKRKRDIWSGPEWIKQQGNASSCNAYMIYGMYLRARALKGLPPVELAPESLYARINGGKDQGSMLDDGMKEMTEVGMTLKGTVPYESYNKRQQFGGNMEKERFALQQAKGYRFFETYALPTNNVRELYHAIVSAVLRGFQVGLAVQVGNNYMRTPNRPWVPYGFDQGPANHAVACDDVIMPRGWDGNILKLYLDQYGSWGLDHAENGRGLLTIRHLVEPAKWHCIYATRSIVSNPEDRCPTLKSA